jgi:PAS domain S-box-containing protein
MIGATQDVSTIKNLQKKLKEQVIIKKENRHVFQTAARLSFDGIWDWDIIKNEFFLGEGFEKLFGYPIKKETGNITDWSKHIHPDDRDRVEKSMMDALASPSSRWNDAYRMIKAGGAVLDVLGRASIMRDQQGKACRMIGVVHDLTSQHQMESKLRHEIAARGKFFSAFQDNFKMIFHSSPEVLYDLDL